LATEITHCKYVPGKSYSLLLADKISKIAKKKIGLWLWSLNYQSLVTS